MKNILNLSLKTITGREFLQESIDIINKDTLLLADRSNFRKNYFIGIKNNKNIERDFIKKICDGDEFIWHTIDSGSDRGRAVDIKLKNPITGSLMTGSSSGTAINVLYGINDLGIGTDGGGSIIYPAMSLNLYSLMGKGIGLHGKYTKESTDGISFTPGIGFISHEFDVIEKAIKKLGYDLDSELNASMRIGTININKIENKELFKKIKLNFDKREINIEDEFNDDRNELMKSLKEIFENKDIIITYENDIEIDGLGDSVFGSLGKKSRKNQKNSKKVLGKVANMMNLTVVTIPDERLASGVIILAREGVEYGIEALKIASKLSGEYLPKLYYRYFKNSYLDSKNDMIFDL
ncbi:amidase family protein [Psychrilyobacter atlanticus]|uniref:amidase family protein n=1 Tax=Psychrilyobacter atlanticus TaxID=271091 RepID=UPI00041BF596|nr:amidase family protein [Psychrilyobacter atlanticus]